MPTRPWLKFYPADWRSDPKLRMCSAGARGIWIDLIALMHEAEPYGHLLINGVNPTNKQLASLLGETPGQVKKWLAELEQADVFSRTEEGVIYSRRMVRDNQRSEQGREHGKAGGNPRLKGQDKADSADGIREGVNPPANPRDNPPPKGRDNASRARVLELRGQILDTTSPPPVTGAAKAGAGAGAGEGFEGLADACRRIQRIVNAGTPLPDLARYVERWRENGLDVERDVIWTIQQVMDRRAAKGQGPPSHPKYFEAAVFRAHNERTAAPPDQQTHPPGSQTTAGDGMTRGSWRKLVDVYQRTGEWHGGGPPPGRSGCRVPTDILAEYGLQQHKRGGGDDARCH